MSADRYRPRMLTVLAARLGDGRVVVVHPDNTVKLVSATDFDAAFEPEEAERGPSPAPVTIVRRRRKAKRVTKRSSRAALKQPIDAPAWVRQPRTETTAPVRRPGRPRRRIEEVDDRPEPRDIELQHPNRIDHDGEITAGLDAHALEGHGRVDPTRPHRKVCGFCAYTSKLSAEVCRRPTCERPFPASSIRPDPE